MLLRAADVKRKQPVSCQRLLLAFFAVTAVPFGLALGPWDPLILLGLAAGAVTGRAPQWGHVFWHLGSSYALFVWWFMLRLRPGDHPGTGRDVGAFSIVLMIALKNAVRRLFMALPLPTQAHRDRLMFLLEHLFFSVWGYYEVVRGQ
jgi:hypothetical protein